MHRDHLNGSDEIIGNQKNWQKEHLQRSKHAKSQRTA